MLRKPSDVYENKVSLRTRRGFPSIVHVYNSRLPFFVNTDIEHSPSEQQCDIILGNCRGLDKTRVVDDQGGLPKTVSCENSFRRGTLCSMKGVWVALGQLFDRLPRLLKDRTSWSKRPDSAYPLTIRLTVRVVDECLRSAKRRPFVGWSDAAALPRQTSCPTRESCRWQSGAWAAWIGLRSEPGYLISHGSVRPRHDGIHSGRNRRTIRRQLFRP